MVGEMFKTVAVSDIPVDAIVEARNSLADEYIGLKVELEKPSIITLLHRKRVNTRVQNLRKYLARLDDWLKGVRK
jgi:hypothetical protein